MLVVTTETVSGYEISRVHGEVFGVTLRARDLGQPGGGVAALGGGAQRAHTQALLESRHEAMGRMIGEAQARGANAIVGMRFDCSAMAESWAEVCAYGTAVTVEPAASDRPDAGG